MFGRKPLSGAALLLLGGLLAGPVAAQETVGVRSGDHPNFGRVVFDWPATIGYRVEETAGRLVLRFDAPAAFDLAGLRRPPRNVLGVTTEAGSAEIRIAPGARSRHFRLGNRVIVDVLDPGGTEFGTAGGAPTPRRSPPSPPTTAEAAPTPRPPARAERAAPPARPAPSRNAATGPVPFQAATPPPAEAPVVVQAAPRAPVQRETLAQAPAAQVPTAQVPTTPAPAAPPAAAPAAARGQPVRLLPGPALSIAAPAEVGAALFQRGGVWMLVLDAPLPLDLAALRANPVFAAAEVSTGPEATTLRLPATFLRAPRLRREGNAWLLDQPREESALRAILPEVEPGPPARLVLRASRAGGSVSVLDPETGTTLLVGTVLDGAEAVPAGRRAALFELLPTRLGAALLPRADTVTLRALPGRFLAGASAGAELALGAESVPASSAAAALTRSFDLPAESISALQERLRNATASVAATGPLGRGAPRLQVAEALLALGLPQEAQAMATLAMREDPVVAESPRGRAMQAVAALLSGRLSEATGLDSPNLPETDELVMWRGLLAAGRGQDGGAAVAAGLPLLLAYPEPLQARLAPLAADALAAGGQVAAARRLLATRDQDDPPLALARARVLEAEGALEPALAAYDSLAAGRDRRARAVAMRRAAELRLANGLLDAAGAAAAMEPTLAAWRGDDMETESRARLAALRLQAGDARGAFDLLRETAAMFPNLAAGLREGQITALLGALEREAPLSAVVLYDAHAEMLPPGEATEQALGALADRLAALDLLDRASHVLRRALTRAADAESKGRLGARLAGLALGAGDGRGALKALEDSSAPALSDELARSRLLLEARAFARTGQYADAAARFRAVGPSAAAELAVLLEERQDWSGAAAALRQHLATVAPPPPAPLTDSQKPILARIAALLTLAGDDAALVELRAEEQARMGEGPMSGTFDLLTSGRVASLSDLPRLREELDVARGLPARLDGLRAETPSTR
ncbi:hypothetical protein ACVFYP_05660 [Roseomonas sp. F4]